MLPYNRLPYKPSVVHLVLAAAGAIRVDIFRRIGQNTILDLSSVSPFPLWEDIATFFTELHYKAVPGLRDFASTAWGVITQPRYSLLVVLFIFYQRRSLSRHSSWPKWIRWEIIITCRLGSDPRVLDLNWIIYFVMVYRSLCENSSDIDVRISSRPFLCPSEV